MRHLFETIVFLQIGLYVTSATALESVQTNINSSSTFLTPIEGSATNDLRPGFVIQKISNDWLIEISFTAQTNFSKYSWLKVPNKIGAKITLLDTNQTEIVSTNQTVFAAKKLPVNTSVLSVIREVHPSSIRGMQWLETEPGVAFTASVFRLKNYFALSSANNLEMQIVPLMYLADTNQVNARLIEFPLVKFKLHWDGKVEHIK